MLKIVQIEEENLRLNVVMNFNDIQEKLQLIKSLKGNQKIRFSSLSLEEQKGDDDDDDDDDDGDDDDELFLRNG